MLRNLINLTLEVGEERRREKRTLTLKKMELASYVLPIRGAVSALMKEFGLPQQMQGFCLRKYLAVVLRKLKKFLDRHPKFPKYESSEVSHALDVICRR